MQSHQHRQRRSEQPTGHAARASWRSYGAGNAAGVAHPAPSAVTAQLERVEIISPVKACRDPKDDKFLEVAVNGEADLIMTGDKDLLALHPFRGMEIITPREYAKR